MDDADFRRTGISIAFPHGWMSQNAETTCPFHLRRIGEAILFPTLNLQADHLAPAHLRGSYFGALSLAGLGFAAGPFAGGVLLQYLGGPWTFMITAAMTVLGGVCYWRSHRMSAPLPSSVYVNSPADLR